MNVVDIRDMPQSQWIFWSTGVPVTALVVALALTVAYRGDQLQDQIMTLRDRWRGKRPGRERITPMDAPQQVMRVGSFARRTSTVMASGVQTHQPFGGVRRTYTGGSMAFSVRNGQGAEVGGWGMRRR